MLPLRTLIGLLMATGLCACAPRTPVTAAVPVIEEAAEAMTRPASALLPEAVPAEVAATFSVTFDNRDGTLPLTAMRLVMEPGVDERAVELVGEQLTLTGIAEAIPGEERWLLGLSGTTANACIVVRMTAERDGDRMRGWATVDTEGRAGSLAFVAEPAG